MRERARSQLPTANVTGADAARAARSSLHHPVPGYGPRYGRTLTTVVIDGEIAFQTGKERLDAGPGDTVIIPSNTPRHRFANSVKANPTMFREWLE